MNAANRRDLKYSLSLEQRKQILQKAVKPKELYIIPNAEDLDFYNHVGLIPFQKLTAFFNHYLR